jgi:hypothetical protein
MDQKPKELEFLSPLFFFLISIAGIWDVSLGIIPFVGGFLTLFFNLLINIQLLLIGYRAGALRLIFAQAIIMLLEFFIPILPSAVENVVVYAIFTKIKKVLAKKNSSEVDEPDEYVAEPA